MTITPLDMALNTKQGRQRYPVCLMDAEAAEIQSKRFKHAVEHTLPIDNEAVAMQ